ncbi:MAG TPA: phosphate ABC transporter permease subunit PstC [Thermoleophilaceae bacterium]|jgi:phosphate transport system permease protein|nr:phosphate ABC transporter permease subunit PstC [Thermoleophilaceae bacterium]
MATPVGPGLALPRRPAVFKSRRSSDRIGDGILYGLCAFASVLAVVILAAVAYQVVDGASPAISKFGLGFVTDTSWQPNRGVFGAGSVIFGTLVSSGMALVIATPLGIAIGLYLALLTSSRIRAIIGPLVEMLAAVPSVILGFWGILVLAPFVKDHIEPWLHDRLGFIPLFGSPQTTGLSMFTAGLILAIMILPIIASISRDLFLAVPREVQDGATALGATRWEVIRGVVLPSAAPGVAAATFLGLGRALGEAIAISQVSGAGSQIKSSLFDTGDTLAARIALQFPGAFSEMHFGALFYLALILLVIGVVCNLVAQMIGRRFDYASTAR